MQLNDESPTQLGWYWMRHKDSDVIFVGQLVKEGTRPMILLPHCGQLSEENFHHYLYAGPLEPPAEPSLGVQMATEADNNRLLTPREMVQDVLRCMDDPKDVLHKINKALFIGLYAAEDHYHTAMLRCNLSNSEAISLLQVRLHELCKDITASCPEPEA